MNQPPPRSLSPSRARAIGGSQRRPGAIRSRAARLNNRDGADLAVGGPAFIRNATFTPSTSTTFDVDIQLAF